MDLEKGILRALAVESRCPAILRFGTFEMNVRAGELHRQGTRIRLQEQPFQLLAVLLQRPGDLVTREELRAHIWPQDTFVDFDNSLNTAAAKLRKALGDSAENPHFIETLPRRGYRFIAPVRQEPAGKSSITKATWMVAALFAGAAVAAITLASRLLWRAN